MPREVCALVLRVKLLGIVVSVAYSFSMPAEAQPATQACAIVRAAEIQDHRLLRREIARGCDVVAPRSDGLTALLAAAKNDGYATARILLANGADGFNQFRRRPIPGVFQGDTALHVAARSGSKAVAMVLVEAHGGLSLVKNHLEETPLVVAAQNGNVDIVEILVGSERAQVNFKGGRETATALWYAARNGHLGVVRALLDDLGALELDAAASDGSTPLIVATRGGYLKLASTLLDAGADVNVKDSSGQSARDYAKDTLMETILIGRERLPGAIRWLVVATAFLIMFPLVTIVVGRLFAAERRLGRILVAVIGFALSFLFAVVLWKDESRMVWFLDEVDSLGERVLLAVIVAVWLLVTWRVLLRLLYAAFVALKVVVESARGVWRRNQ